ncbi:hypothetical protein CYMTET_41012 [Cymbomonas tetramitiformis]|uniref:Uncharacterized protein n=1 Tax=Cymbomonas tetramitiformis TaxID=36881 RepID=A0AAE0C6W8_9CHLO|nr:hypothetical protein CYMTET_41012 [Cymbomonas tetramitiformis]
MTDEVTIASAERPDSSQLRCALDLSRTLTDASFGELVYRTAQVIAFARGGERCVNRRQPSEVLSVFSKHDSAHSSAIAFLQRPFARDAVLTPNDTDHLEKAIDIADAYISAQADLMETQFESGHRLRGVHFLPLRISRQLGRNPQRWFEFLSGAYADALFHRQYDICSATAVHIVPLVAEASVDSSRRFPWVNAFLHIRTWVEDTQGKIRRHARAVAHLLRGQPSQYDLSEQPDTLVDIDRVVDELKHAFERADYETGKRFLTTERIDARFYRSTRDDDVWRDDDAFCLYVSVGDAYFQDERNWLSDAVTARSKADILRNIKHFATRRSTLTAFGCVDELENEQPGGDSTDLLTLLRSRAVTDRIAARVQRQRTRLIGSKKSKSTREDAQPDQKRARFVSVMNEAQRDCWGWCSAQLVSHHTSAHIDERFVSLVASSQQLSIRKTLERPIITDLPDDRTTVGFRYLPFVCSVKLNESHRRNELTARLYGVVCVPGDVSNKDLNGGCVFPGKVVCGVIGTAHQLRNEDTELSGTAHEWCERPESTPSTLFPFYLDCSSRPSVHIDGRRTKCTWIPHTGFWKLLAVKPVYRENCDLSAIRRSTDIELHETDETEANEAAPIGYVFGGTTEDTLHALPQRVRCAVSNSLSELHSRKKTDALDRAGDRFPDMWYGYAATVCAVELLETLDFTLCSHMVQQLLGVRLNIVRGDGSRFENDRLNVALGSTFTVKRDAWVDDLTLIRRCDRYHDQDDHPLHESLFHAARLAIPSSSESRLGFESAADEKRRETEYYALRQSEKKGAPLETNWHVMVERHDAARVSRSRSGLLSRNPRSVADSAWIFARCYVNPCSALMFPNAESLSEFEAIKRSQGREGCVRFASTGMTLRWRCDRRSDGTARVETCVHSTEARLDRTRLEIDGEDVQYPPNSCLDLYEGEERGKYFERVHSSERTCDTVTERCWRLLRIDVGSTIRIATSCLCVQLILVP